MAAHDIDDPQLENVSFSRKHQCAAMTAELRLNPVSEA
jgi:hypothetical protein